MEKIKYDNLNYTALIFELISFLVWFTMILCIYDHNFKPILMLCAAGLLLFTCTFSLLGDRNEMQPDYSF